MSVSTPNNTPLFNFSVRPQTIYTRPSFNAAIISSRALDITSEDITVTSSHPSFAVQKSNHTYTLITNTSYISNINNFNIYIHIDFV